MFGPIKKFAIILVTLLFFQSSFALDMCSLEGDFVPWPWSDQNVSYVLDQNWVMVDDDGQPTSELVISKSKILWGWAGSVYTLIERDMDGQVISWGTAGAYDYQQQSQTVDFQVWKNDEKVSTPVRGNYSFQIGYWSSATNQVPLDEVDKFERNPLDAPFLDEVFKICKTFRHRSDHVVGLIVEKSLENEEEGSNAQTFFGVTENPMHVQTPELYINK